MKFDFFKQLFGARKPKPSPQITPENVDHPDPWAREMIARCWNENRTIVAHREEPPESNQPADR